MGERKVLNRYIPPDFDPSILPKGKRDFSRPAECRMMLPFSMKCLTCGNYMYRGKKFNSKKELMKGQDYLGIHRWRFYVKCSMCAAEICFATDPKNTDYELESGATRNFEMWRENSQLLESEKASILKESVDAMKALENKTIDSKVELDILDALDEIKAINQRHERVDTNALLDHLNPATILLPNGLTKEDEELIKSIDFKSKKRELPITEVDSVIADNSDIISMIKQQITNNQNIKKDFENIPIIIKKKKKIENTEKLKSEDIQIVDNKDTTAAVTNNLSGLFGGYGDSDDD